jgi:hypothetical protein
MDVYKTIRQNLFSKAAIETQEKVLSLKRLTVSRICDTFSEIPLWVSHSLVYDVVYDIEDAFSTGIRRQAVSYVYYIAHRII